MFITQDGLKLHVESHTVPDAKALVVIAHGLGEHIGRYAHVITALNQAGYSVVGLDHRAHGKSAGEPRAFFTSVKPFVADLKAVWDEHPHPRKFLLGHSMGGLIAGHFALRYQQEMRGLILSGAAFISGSGLPAPVISLLKGLAKIAPTAPLASLSSAGLSRDPQVIKAYEADPLVYHGWLKIGMLAALFGEGQEALQQAHTLTLPLLVMHGGADKITAASGSRQFYEQARSTDKALKIYEGFYHEILNEPEKATLLSEITGWLDAHL